MEPQYTPNPNDQPQPPSPPALPPPNWQPQQSAALPMSDVSSPKPTPNPDDIYINPGQQNPQQAVSPQPEVGQPQPNEPSAVPTPPPLNQPIYPQNIESPMPSTSQPAPQPTYPAQPVTYQEDDRKDFVVAFLLSWLLGPIGADRFYLGYTGLGVLKLLTFGGLGIWAVIDELLLAFGKLKDKSGLPLKGYDKNKKWVRIVSILHIIFVVVFVGILLTVSIFTTKGGIQNIAFDAKRKTDVNTVHDRLEAYKSAAFKYPTLNDINSASFRQTYMSGLQDYSLQDPKGTSPTLVSSPTIYAYSYEPMPVGCDNVKNSCTSYTLTATLETGGTYVKQSP